MNQLPRTRTLLSLVAALALSACNGVGQGGPSSGEDGQSDVELALGEEYGALTDADEEPDFGDEDIATAEDLNDDGADVADEVADEAEASVDDAALPVRRLPVLIAWGKLRGGPVAEGAAPLDWSGTLSVDNAALRVRRTVAFDANDELLPRTSATEVSFVSHTKPHVDGLLVEVLLHPALGSSPDSPSVLHFSSPSYTGSLVLERGMDPREGTLIDDAGNGIAYTLLPVADARPDCRTGFIAGRFVEVGQTADGRPVGRILGKVLSAEGRVVGKVKGIWGEREANGSPVFFAKLIDNNGRFRAVIAGHYGQGKFAGRVIGKDRVRLGATRGIYRVGQDSEGADRGLFRGRIGELCGELPDEGETETHDEQSADTLTAP